MHFALNTAAHGHRLTLTVGVKSLVNWGPDSRVYWNGTCGPCSSSIYLYIHICRARHPRMLAAIAQSKKDQIRYDEMNWWIMKVCMMTDTLNLKHTPKHKDKNSSGIFILFFSWERTKLAELVDNQMKSCNSEFLVFDLYSREKRLHKKPPRRWDIPRNCAAQGPAGITAARWSGRRRTEPRQEETNRPVRLAVSARRRRRWVERPFAL